MSIRGSYRAEQACSPCGKLKVSLCALKCHVCIQLHGVVRERLVTGDHDHAELVKRKQLHGEGHGELAKHKLRRGGLFRPLWAGTLASHLGVALACRVALDNDRLDTL